MHEKRATSDRQLASLVDLAQQIDSETAEKLVTLVDADPAREAGAEAMRRRIVSAKLHKSLLVGEWTAECGETPETEAALLRACGELNAGFAPSRKLEEFGSLLGKAADLTSRQCANIIRLSITNADLRFRGSRDSARNLRPIVEALLLAGEIFVRVASRKGRDEAKSERPATHVVHDSRVLLVKEGERNLALEWIRSWLEECGGDEIIICDRYFSPEDLVFIRHLQEWAPHRRVQILSGIHEQVAHARDGQTLEETYRAAWHTSVSSLDPPDTEFVLVGNRRGGACPIHDRWLVAGGSALSIGTSLKSVGVERLTSLQKLSGAEAEAILAELRRYCGRQVRTWNAEKLQYIVFGL